MSDTESWIERRLVAALAASMTDRHLFPDAVPAELRTLLAGQFQEPRKPAEIDSIAITLISANRDGQ